MNVCLCECILAHVCGNVTMFHMCIWACKALICLGLCCKRVRLNCVCVKWCVHCTCIWLVVCFIYVRVMFTYLLYVSVFICANRSICWAVSIWVIYFYISLPFIFLCFINSLNIYGEPTVCGVHVCVCVWGCLHLYTRMESTHALMNMLTRLWNVCMYLDFFICVILRSCLAFYRKPAQVFLEKTGVN